MSIDISFVSPRPWQLDADHCLNEADGNVRFDCRLGCSSSDIDRQRIQ